MGSIPSNPLRRRSRPDDSRERPALSKVKKCGQSALFYVKRLTIDTIYDILSLSEGGEDIEEDGKTPPGEGGAGQKDR